MSLEYGVTSCPILEPHAEVGGCGGIFITKIQLRMAVRSLETLKFMLSRYLLMGKFVLDFHRGRLTVEWNAYCIFPQTSMQDHGEILRMPVESRSGEI